MPTIAKTFHGEGRFEKNPFDFFQTPFSLAKAAVQILKCHEDDDYAPYRTLDPGCGTGVWGRAFKRYFPDAHITGVDLQYLEMPHGYDEVHLGYDFLDWTSPEHIQYDWIIGNPPYSSKTNKRLAEHFVHKARCHLSDYGRLMFLLKMDFAGGKERFSDLFMRYKPTHIYKCAGRVPFMEDTRGNKTNTHEYALFIWNKQNNAHDTKFRWFSWDKKGLVAEIS